MSFYTAINCMDGRVQLPVIYYLKERFGVPYVDVITEPGPVALLSSDPESDASRSIFQRVEVSLNAHHSKGIAMVAHYNCAGNPVSDAEQREQMRVCLRVLAKRYPAVALIGLWVDDTWAVSEIESDLSVSCQGEEDN